MATLKALLLAALFVIPGQACQAKKRTVSLMEGERDASDTLRMRALAPSLRKRASSTSYANDNSFFYSSNSPFLILDNGVNFHFQVDGNFVVYDSNSHPLWNSKSEGHTCDPGRCKLQFQGDGNLVAVDYGVSPPNPFWHTNTNSYAGHSWQATTLTFSESAPYVALYAGNGALEFASAGTNMMVFPNPSPNPAPPRTGGAPSGGMDYGSFCASQPNCMICEGDCTDGCVYNCGDTGFGDDGDPGCGGGDDGGDNPEDGDD